MHVTVSRSPCAFALSLLRSHFKIPGFTAEVQLLKMYQALPPPPTEAPPRPPRRVSTIMMPGISSAVSVGSGEDAKPPVMKRMARVMSTRRYSIEKEEEKRGAAEADSSLGYHLDAFNGAIGVIERAIRRDEYIVNRYFSYSVTSLLTDEEERNEHYIPPPPLPKLIKLTLKKPVQTMTLDQRWLLSHAFADSTLLHYACAGDQYAVVKLLLEKGADWTLVNASDKTAEEYAQSDQIKELFVNADERYNRLPPLTQSKPPKPLVQQAMEDVVPSPAPAVASILKTPGTGRRRQSIVNDAAWADSNLRSTVHQSQAPLVRATSLNSASFAATAGGGGTTTAGSPSQRKTLGGSFRRPDEDELEQEEAPLATIVPMSFGASSSKLSAKSLLSNTNTASTYSAATSVHSSDIGALDFAPSVQDDAASVGTVGTGTSSNPATGTKMNARRRSRVVQSLRLRGTLGGPENAVNEGKEASAPAPRAQPRRVAPPPPAPLSANTDHAAPRSPVKQRAASTVAAAADSEVAAAGAVRASDRSPLRRTKSTSSVRATKKATEGEKPSKKSDTVETKDADSGNDSDGKPRRKTTASKSRAAAALVSSDEEERDSQQATASKPKARKSQSSDKRGSSAKLSRSKSTRQVDSAEAGAAAEAPAPEQESEVSALVVTAPPPLRVMRRLSVNMAQGALQAVSYVVGAQGEQQVVESSLIKVASDDHSTDGKQNSAEADAPPASSVAPSFGMSKLFPGPSSVSGANSVAGSLTSQAGTARSVQSLTAATAALDLTAQKKAALDLVAESGEDAYLEAWECKATDQSPFARLQSSLLSGFNTENSVQQAAALIAKVNRLEKQEAREAMQISAGRAERLQQLMKNLTPIENIASGVLRGQQQHAAGVSRLLAEQHADSGDEVHEGEGDTSSENARRQAADSSAAGAETSASPSRTKATERAQVTGLELGSPGRPSLTFRELIWRRAGFHMNSALSDKHRNEYDRARAEAYKLGVQLLKREFRDMAQQERWEAVALMEEQRLQDADKQLKASARIMMGLRGPEDGREETEGYRYERSDDQADEEWQSFVDRSGRHQSFRPFAAAAAEENEGEGGFEQNEHEFNEQY